MPAKFACLPVACVLMFAGAAPALAADMDVRSAIDAVTVYPGRRDGHARRHRRPARRRHDADRDAISRPVSIPPRCASKARAAAASPSARSTRARRARSGRSIAPELEKRIEALRDERAVLDDTIAAATARKTFVERFATNVPFGLGEKGEARPLAEWRAAFARGRARRSRPPTPRCARRG